MLVDKICIKSLHFRPKEIELFSFRVRSGRAYYLNFRIFLADSLDKRLQTLRILRAPLFVSDADELHSERFRMSHLRTKASPLCIHTAIGKFYKVQCILDITVKLVHRLMGIHCLVLELAGQSAADHRKRLCSDFFRQKEILIKAKSVRLVIIRIIAMLEAVLPSVLVKRTVLHRAHAVLPAVTGFQIGAFHYASSRKAEKSGLQVIESLCQIFSETILMSHPGIHRKE